MQNARDDQARGATVDVVTWTGRTACALQQALRMTNDDFADHLGVAVRTVANWHSSPNTVPRTEIQSALDTAYERSTASVQRRFSLLTRSSLRLDGGRAGADQETEAALHRWGRPFVGGVQGGLDLGPRHDRRRRVPACHRADADAEVLGEGVVRHSEGLLQGACGAAGPRHDVHFAPLG